MASINGVEKKELKKSISTEECRKKRTETSVSIRKNKRDEGLRKRRAMMQKTPVELSPVKISPESSNLTKIYENIKSQDYDMALGATQAIRKMLSKNTDPPVQQVLDAGVLPFLLEFLKCNDKPSLQFESLWALTNIGSTEFTPKIVDAGIIPLLVPLLVSGNADVREQAVWCLGNIAGKTYELSSQCYLSPGDNNNYRDMLIETANCVESLTLNIHQPVSITSLRVFVWVASNLLRGKPKPGLSKVEKLVDALLKILPTVNDEDVLLDLFWALSYITDGPNENISFVVKYGVCPSLVTRLKSLLSGGNKQSMISPLLRTLGRNSLRSLFVYVDIREYCHWQR